VNVFLTLHHQNIMFRARVTEWLIPCVIGCSSSAQSFHLLQAKWHSGGLDVHDNGSRSHTNMHQKAKWHIWKHARAWGDTSGLHGNLINQSRDTGEDLLTETVK
jgi:hypothetical protein